jgi:endonuclease/exonuclease/phosphatase family metal-dependent hydrolase
MHFRPFWPATKSFLFSISLIAIFSGCIAEKETSVTAPEPQILRIMTYNIHHGRGTDGKVDPARTAAVIKEANADIVGLQEVDKNVRRSGNRDLTAEIADLLGMHFYFDKNINFDGGEYGSAILSRFPILEKTNTHYKMLRPGEQRGLQQVILDVNGRKILFMNTHIDYRPEDEERLLNIIEMKEAAERHPDLPTFLVGDFNDLPGSRTLLSVQEMFTDTWAEMGEGDGTTHIHATDGQHKRLDYIFYRTNESIQPLKIWVTNADASDHFPVVAEFLLR